MKFTKKDFFVNIKLCFQESFKYIMSIYNRLDKL